MENCGRFVFYNNILFLLPCEVPWKITYDMLCQFPWTIPSQTIALNHQCERIRSVVVKYKNVSHSIGCMMRYYRNCPDVVRRLFVDY